MNGPTATDQRVIDVCNAALMEIGHPSRAFWSEEHGFPRCTPVGDPVMRRRAAALAATAVHGPDHLMRCVDCTLSPVTRPKCTTARDVLRGVRCQGPA